MGQVISEIFGESSFLQERDFTKDASTNDLWFISLVIRTQDILTTKWSTNIMINLNINFQESKCKW